MSTLMDKNESIAFLKKYEAFEEDEYSFLTNREKSRKATKHKYWCNCDMAMVGEYKKCPICGNRGKKIKNV